MLFVCVAVLEFTGEAGRVRARSVVSEIGLQCLPGVTQITSCLYLISAVQRPLKCTAGQSEHSVKLYTDVGNCK